MCVCVCVCVCVSVWVSEGEYKILVNRCYSEFHV